MKECFRVLAIAVLSGSLCACNEVEGHNKAALYSTVASLHEALIQTKCLTTNITRPATINWQIVTEEEYDICMRQLLGAGLIDTKRPRKGELVHLLDPWGRRFLIAYSQNTNGEMVYIVWSAGKDGVSGTTDDVVSPIGASPPPMSKTKFP